MYYKHYLGMNILRLYVLLILINKSQTIWLFWEWFGVDYMYYFKYLRRLR